MNKKSNSIGLWKSKEKDKNGKFYYSGKLPNGEWINLYQNNSENPKAPQLNLVLPEGYQIIKEIEGTLDDVASFQKQNMAGVEDIPF